MTKQIRELDPIDVAVGSKIKARRKLFEMSQDNLAKKIGLTFQQVQKYENGKNRVSISRLIDICKALRVTPGYFFEDIFNDFEPLEEKEFCISFNYKGGFNNEVLSKGLTKEIAINKAIARLEDEGIKAKDLSVHYAEEA